MKKAPPFVLALSFLLVSLLVGGCQLFDGGPSEERLFSYAKNIAEIRGHLQTALANSEVGAHDHTKDHFEHLIKEGNFSVISEPLEAKDPGLAIQLKLLLIDLSAVSHDPVKTRKLMRLFDKVLKALVPKDKLENPAFQARTIQAVLEDVEDEYGEALNKKGRIGNAEEYQEAFGFLIEARSIYRKLKDRLGNDTQEIDKLFAELDEALPQITPPRLPVSETEVGGTTVEQIKQKLGQAAGLSANNEG